MLYRFAFALMLCLLGPLWGCATPRVAGPWAAPQDQTFQSTLDSSSQHYVIMKPQAFNPARSHDLLIVLHGHGADRWQFVKSDRDECRAARDLAARYQMIYVSPDYRAPTSWMGPAAEVDLVQLLGSLKKEYKIRRVVIAGASMGGTSALIFTILHPGLVDGVVSQNGMANMLEYDNFAPYIAESYGGDKTAKPEIYRARSAELHPERFRVPLAVTTGGQDTTVPPASVLRLVAQLQSQGRPVFLIHRPQTEHLTNYDDSLAAYQFVLERALRPHYVPLWWKTWRAGDHRQ